MTQEELNLRTELEQLREEVADHHSLIAMQHRRTVEADRAFQQAHSDWPEGMLPDLGELIQWLMDERARLQRELDLVKA